jgi:catechol 2,3-dioxygenase-like lactoylglutathione lyase family enzyme
MPPTPTTRSAYFSVWHVAFTVGDLNRSIAFYCDALGFELISRDADSAFVSLGKGGFTLEFIIDGGSPEASSIRPHHIAFEAEDLSVLRERLETAGVEVTEIAKIGPRAARMTTMDPDGLKIDLFQARDEIEAWMARQQARHQASP